MRLVLAFWAVAAIFPSCTAVKFGLPKELVAHGGASRILAENEQETADMEVSVPLSQAAAVDADSTLMKDIQMLNDILAELVDRENPEVHDLYRKFRQLGLDR
jgi:hypothetical protein